jgi:hypothetical protein
VCSSEGKNEGFDARIKEANLESPPPDVTILPHELVEARLGDGPVAVGIDVGAV